MLPIQILARILITRAASSCRLAATAYRAMAAGAREFMASPVGSLAMQLITSTFIKMEYITSHLKQILPRAAIHIECRGAKEIIKEFEGHEKNIPRVASTALNRAAEHGRAVMVKAIRGKYSMKAGYVRDGIEITRSRQQTLTAIITISAKPIPLIEFAHRGWGASGKRRYDKQVEVEVIKGVFKILPQAFIARVSSEQILARRGKQRGPLKAFYGPSLAGILNNETMMNMVKNEIRKEFADEFMRGLKFGRSR